MHGRVAAFFFAVLFLFSATAGAQTVAPAPGGSARSAPPPDDAAALAPAPDSSPAPGDAGFWAPFKAMPRDLVRFFSADTTKVLSVGGLGALAAHQWDHVAIRGRQAPFRPGVFRAGNLGATFFVQAGASVGLYSIGKLGGSNKLADVGRDLVRAQALSQAVVQTGKFVSRRRRPDASNNHSLPSGHAASAFATATVIQQHFGWKVGIPAYGFGAYVAASRMSANKHHLSDVVLGAAVGIAAGRTVTVGTGRTRFELGVAPTAGGAAITFTKR